MVGLSFPSLAGDWLVALYMIRCGYERTTGFLSIKSSTQLLAAYSRPGKLIHHCDNDEATYRLLLLKVKEAIKSLTDNRLSCQRHHRIN